MTTSEAKAVYKQFMLQIGFLAREELSAHAGDFAEEMRSHEAFLKEELARAKEDFGPYIEAAKEEVRELKKELRAATDPASKTERQAELEDAEREVVEESLYVKKAEDEYRAFKEDKRAFLVAYISQQTQRE